MASEDAGVVGVKRSWNADGTMARGEQEAQFARTRSLACTTVAAIADYRRAAAWSRSGG
jgi:3,4-dihydroxy-2-butanone 4-phosphate synthase